MAKYMRAAARVIDTRPRQGLRGDDRNRRCVTESRSGSVSTKKKTAIDARRPPICQIIDDRFPDVLRKRHPCPSATLAAYRQRSLFPVQIIESEGRHLAGSESKPSE